jgi:hypothetical protein
MEAHMSISSDTITRSDRVACPRCGANGALRWEDSSGASGRQLVAIEGGFHERLAKTPPHVIELVCDGCGAVQKAA